MSLSTPQRRLTRSSSRQRESLGMNEEEYMKYLNTNTNNNNNNDNNNTEDVDMSVESSSHKRKRRSVSQSPARTKRNKSVKSTTVGGSGDPVDTIMEEDEEMTLVGHGVEDSNNNNNNINERATRNRQSHKISPHFSPRLLTSTPNRNSNFEPLSLSNNNKHGVSEAVSGSSSSTSTSYQPISILSSSRRGSIDHPVNGISSLVEHPNDQLSKLQHDLEVARVNLRSKLPDDIHTLVNEVINRCGAIEPYHTKGIVSKSNHTLISLSEALLTAMRNYGPESQASSSLLVDYPSPKFALSDAFCHELGRSLPVVGSAELRSISFPDLFSKSTYAYQLKYAPIPLALRILRLSPLMVDSVVGMMNAPAISVSIKEGDVESVKWLLNMRADPTIPDSEGNTPLHYAIRYCPETISYLLKCGAAQSLHTANQSGNTPITLASNLNVQLNAVTSSSNTTDLCTFASTGLEQVSQDFFECLDCPFNGHKAVCSTCAVRCHSGHIQRRVFESSVGFCDCGEAGSSVCKSLTRIAVNGTGRKEWSSISYVPPTFSSGNFSNLTKYTNPMEDASREAIYAYLQMAEKLLLERENVDREDGKLNSNHTEDLLTEESIYGWEPFGDEEGVPSGLWKTGKDELELLHSRSSKSGGPTTLWLFVFLACVALIIVLALHPVTSSLFQTR